MNLPPDPLTPLAMQIQVFAALFLKFHNQALEARLDALGYRFSALQYGLLRMLQFETLTISELSQRMGLDPSTLVRSIDALERKGLVQRGQDPQDRRRNPIHITPEGQNLLAAVPLFAPDDPLYQALQMLGLEDTRQLRDLLQALISQIPEGRMVAGLVNPPGGPVTSPG